MDSSHLAIIGTILIALYCLLRVLRKKVRKEVLEKHEKIQSVISLFYLAIVILLTLL